MPRIAANGLAGMYGRPPLSAWLSGSSAVAAIATPMPSPIRRVVRSSLLLRSVQVAWGSVWDRRLRLSSPAGRVCAPPQRRSLPLARLSKDGGASTRRA